MRAHELWRERASGEVWAVELRQGVVVGCCGPLTAEEREPRYLDGLDYSPARAGWVEEHRDAFDLYEAALR